MKRLNLRLAAILGVIFVASVAGVYFLHKFQINRNAGNLLVESRRLTEENNMQGAERALSRYVAFRPDDVEAQEEILEIHKKMFEQEPTPRTYSMLNNSYERMVVLQPDNAELRRSYMELCLATRNTIVAQQQLIAIRKLGKSTADDEYKEAVLSGIKSPESAIPLLAKIIGFDPETKVFNPTASKNSKQYRAYFDLANLYLQQPVTADLAPLIIEELTTQHADEADAQRYVYEYWMRQGQGEKARPALAKAVQISPDDLGVMNLQFNQFVRARDFESALKIAERLEKLAPKAEEAYLSLATVYDLTKQREKALDSVERGLAKLGNRVRLLMMKLKLILKSGNKDVVAAREILMQLQGIALPAEAMGLMSLFEGQILIQEEKYSAALDKLNAASKRLTEPQDQFAAEVALAECYTALGSYDLARTIYEKILNSYPSIHEVRMVLANLLLRTGKQREAQRELELLNRVLPAETLLSQPRIWQPLLDTRIAEQLAKPAANRDWTSVNELVGKLKELPKEVLPEDDKTLLQARILAHQGELDKALALILPLRQQQPNNLKYWIEWSLLEARRRQPRELLQQLATAPAAVQHDQRMLLIQGNQWAAIGGEEGKAGLLELLNKTAGLDKNIRLTIHLLISQALAQIGQFEDAKKVATLAIPLTEGTKPRDLRPQQVLLAYAREQGDIPEMEKLYEQIRKAAGTNSDNQIYAKSLVLLAKLRASQKKKINTNSVQIVLDASEDKLLREVETLASKLLELRGDWPETYKLLADIAGYRNNSEGMIEALKNARSKGNLEPYRLRQLAQLLYQKNEFKESEAILDQLTGQGDTSLIKLKFQLLIQEDKKSEAEALLQKLSLTEQATPDERLWMAQALRQLGQLEKSEEMVRAIVQKDEKLELADAWLLLANLLREQRKSSEAHQLLERVQKLSSTEQQQILVARVAEIIGEVQVASQLFTYLTQLYPASLRASRELASFHLRQKNDQLALTALDQLSQLIDKYPRDPLADEYRDWTNRAKLVTDMASGSTSYEAFVAYDKQLKKSIEDHPDEIYDLVLRISLLAQRKEAESLRKAIELLQEFDRRQPLHVGDQLMLAQLYSKVGDWTKGRALIETLALKPGANPKLLVAYAELLIQNEEYSTALRYLERYMSETKDRQPYLLLLAKVHAKLGDEKKSLAAVQEWLGKRPVQRENLQKLLVAAMTLEDFGQIAAAEDFFRELAQSGVEGRIELAKFIGRQRDLNTGLEMLQQVFETTGEKVAAMLVKSGIELLNSLGNEVTEMQKQQALQRLGVWYKAYLAGSPDPTQKNNLTAELRILQENYAEAAQLYRNAIEQIPDKNSTLVASMRNNLAYVLALTGDKQKYPEALEAIEQAIRTLGPQSDLLDTRGLLLLQMGDYAKAEQDLQDAVLQPNASKYFRLAYALFKREKPEEATAAIRKARQEGLKLRELSPTEQTYYEQMRVALGDNAFASAAP